MMTPKELAWELNISRQELRSWLRSNYRHKKYARWIITAKMATAACKYFIPRSVNA